MNAIKFTALLIVFVVSLSGCTPGTPAASSSPGASASPNASDLSFPLDEAVRLTLWMPFTSTLLASPVEAKANIEVERRTNVHIDYTISSPDEATANFNLMLATKIYNDILFMQDSAAATSYIGGHDKAREDGVFLKLNDLIDKWAPNYKALLESNDVIYKQSTTDGKDQAVFTTILKGNRPAWIGPMIRKDLLDTAGLSIPQTYDELHTALIAFKDTGGVEQPLSIYHLGYNPTTHSLTSGFDIGPGFYNENGTVKFGFIESGFRDYLTMMNKWYEEKLIDPNFSLQSTQLQVKEESLDKIGAAEHALYTLPDTDPRFVAMPIPRKSPDKVAHFRMVNEITDTTPAALTTNLNDDETRLEVAVKWMDYRYSEEGARIINYGVQGESFKVVDGKPQFTEFIYKHPDYTPAEMVETWTDSKFGCYLMWERENVMLSPEELSAYKVWGDSSSGDWVMPPVSMTEDEAAEFKNIYNDISPFINDSVAKFIKGNIPMSEYDAFVSTITDLKLERCIEIYQVALDRYNRR